MILNVKFAFFCQNFDTRSMCDLFQDDCCFKKGSELRYDIIADVHGHANALEELLLELGYRDDGIAFYHSERTAVFVGDLIDRGPEQLRTLAIVRSMEAAGNALVAMGNHEFNAIGFATPRADGEEYLRVRDEKNRRQHHRFLDEVGEDSKIHEDAIAWMKTLPLWIDLPGIRVVHACWHPEAMSTLSSCLDDRNRLTEEGIHRVNERGTAEYVAAEIVLKGLDVALPEGCVYVDADGHERHNTRVRWWDGEAATFRTAALVDDELRARIPDEPIPSSHLLTYDDAKPLFFGHYWLQGEPVISSPRMACLDYSVAKDGVLCAYSWDGEENLDVSKLSWVSPEPSPVRAIS